MNKIKDKTKLKRIIDYFIKYIQKSIYDNSFPNQKKYITSRGLLRPKEQYFEEVIKLIENMLPAESLIFQHDGETEYYEKDPLEQMKSYLKWINYFQYDLSDNKKLDEEIEEMLETYS